MNDELVLLAQDATPIGTAPRASIHGVNTPFHLAFSCHLFDGTGNGLITRRALNKRSWPGVWSNACCGHPQPGEDLKEAVRRRFNDELGISVEPILLIPDFRYRSTDPGGVVENEFCPVFVATARDARVAPNPEEVMEYRWVRSRPGCPYAVAHLSWVASVPLWGVEPSAPREVGSERDLVRWHAQQQRDLLGDDVAHERREFVLAAGACHDRAAIDHDPAGDPPTADQSPQRRCAGLPLGRILRRDLLDGEGDVGVPRAEPRLGALGGLEHNVVESVASRGHRRHRRPREWAPQAAAPTVTSRRARALGGGHVGMVRRAGGGASVP